VVNGLKCEYMRDRVGETCPGVVTAVTGFGLFVELTDIYVEGLVHITALPADYYHFDPVHHRLAGERAGRSYRLGDSVEVLVARVDLDERKIDFELAGSPQTVVPGRKRQGGRAGSGEAAHGKASGRQRGEPREPAQSAGNPRLQAPKTGRVQALPEVAPELLEQADALLGNVDVQKSRAVKKKLLDEAKAPAKPAAKSAKAAGAGKTAGKKGVPRPIRVARPSKAKASKPAGTAGKTPAADAPAGRAIRKRKVEE
jgi:ribonuclease R